MQDFIDESDGKRWSATVILRGETMIPFAVSLENESLPLPELGIRQGNSQGELLIGEQGSDERALLTKVGDTWWIHHAGQVARITVDEYRGKSATGGAGGLVAPMPGKVIAVLVDAGESVDSGQALVVMEAMKMEHRISAHVAGTIENIYCEVGSQVDQGTILVALQPNE